MTCADARAEPPVISAAPTNISRKRFIIPPIFSQARLSTPLLRQVLGFFLLLVKTPAQGHCFERLVTILKALYRNVWLCKPCSLCDIGKIGKIFIVPHAQSAVSKHPMTRDSKI
jgi:hypothetical protein